MRLAYITTVQISDKDAQSLQIRAMAKSFDSILKKDFLLISPGNPSNANMQSEYSWKKLKIFQNPRWLRYCLTIVSSLGLVLKFKPDIIYSRDILVVFFYKLLGYNSVYEIHKPFETWIGNFIFYRLSGTIKIVAISQSLKDFLIKKYKLEESQILVAHDGVFLDDFFKDIIADKEKLKVELFGVSGNKFVVLYSGSFQKGKGVESVLNTAKDIYNINKEIVFVFLGADDNQNFDNVIFIRRVLQNEVIKYLRTADLLILPTNANLLYFNYTSPLKLFEYMASGTPILATRSASVNEVIDNSLAFLVDDSSQFAETIKNIISSYDVAELKSTKASQEVKKYDWFSRANKIVNFLKTI